MVKRTLSLATLGTPILAVDSEGNEVWNRQLDIYGRVKREIKASSLGDDVRPFIPFLYQGQYYDFETKLAYNRFRYYSPETGAYISQDPIGLAGGNPTIYGYVKDSNWWVDVFGLDCESNKSGERGIKKALKDLEKAGFTNIEKEVLMIVNGSQIRADITARDADGNLHVFEVKNNSGTLTPNQKAANVFSLDNDKVANPNNSRDIDTSRGVTADYKITTSRKHNAGEKGSEGTATFYTLHYSDE